MYPRRSKMALKVEVISKEMIKPSSPTPHHLINHKLSFLDQIVPPVYVPMLFFYEPTTKSTHHHEDTAEKSKLLKQSLSETLTVFYPLAGRINKNNVSIDCNDAGAEYVEARVHDAQFWQVIEQPKAEDLKQFLPFEPYDFGLMGGREVLLGVKINMFDCGGMAIAVCIAHTVADGSSLVTFINAWAAKSRGAAPADDHVPSFDLASYFPPKDHLSGFASTTGITHQNVHTRRFVFDKRALTTLKGVASTAFGSQVKDPTRVEVVSAYIWKHIMEAAKFNRNIMDPAKMCAVNHAVNLRPRMSPPHPQSSIGNLWRVAMGLLTSEAENGYLDLISELRTAIKKIDSDYMKMLIDGDRYLDFLKSTGEQFSTGEVEFYSFSSWCRFPVYEADYGWGRPVWVSTTTMPFKNVVILMSTSCGDGIEAWVTLLAEDMVVLERDQEFLSLLTVKDVMA